MLVPEPDTGRIPKYGKALEVTLFKELGILASYVSNKRCFRGSQGPLEFQ